MKFTQPRATQPRATLEETLEFANAVRKAGGGTPIDALIPSIPTNSEACLIARNLNFNSRVDACDEADLSGRWFMAFEDATVRDDVAKALNLACYGDDFSLFGVLLPPEIGAVALAYDDTMDALYRYRRGMYDKAYAEDGITPASDYALIKEFWPYIQESSKAAYASAAFVAEDGSIL